MNSNGPHPRQRFSLNRLLCVSSFIVAFALLITPKDTWAQTPTVEKIDHMPAVMPIQVHAVGRVQHAGDGMFRYQWPGIYFVASYRGHALYFKTDGGDQNLHISIDGHALPPLIRVAPGYYRIANSKSGNHLVRISVVNENQDGPKSLGNFSIEANGHALITRTRERQVEFIGDSHTVGYGNISPSRTCTADQLWNGTDSSQSIGADTAFHYHADYQINAISGRGVIRNYSGGPGDPLPVAYPFNLFDKQAKYKDPAWHPAVVVISLGTNDFSTPLHPDEPWKTRADLHTAFEQTFADFVKRVRARNPKALIVLWSTVLSNGEIAAESQKVVETIRSSGDHRVDFVPVAGLTFTGCDWHPSASDDSAISKKLIEDIDTHKDVWP